jgi:Peptide N-acetyl-beta-D-glucosaminyl asparaginase amidase A
VSRATGLETKAKCLFAEGVSPVKSQNVEFVKYPALALILLSSIHFAFAQSTNRQIGTQFTVTADPLIRRPHSKPCVVSLFSNFQFAFFSQTNQNFPSTPPANCSGPYGLVVLDVDFSENAGVQFDRTATMYIANTNVYFGTTPEPLSSATNTWHIERDVTDYAALFSSPQQGTMVLQNCTTDCPPPYNTRLNGVFTVSAKLEFYPAGSGDDGHGHRAADLVLPMTQSNGSGGFNLPAFLTLPPNELTTTFNLPTNVEEAYLDVISQSQQSDEQWFACFPTGLGAINELYGCGNTDFRETEISIDGQPAGIAPVSPWVFTGFLPDQWQPIPAVQTLSFIPYRVNLTPFAATLSDGKPHTIALSVFDQNYYFSEAASLLVYLDPRSSKVTGAVTKNTLTIPSPTVTENLQGTSTVTGTIGVSEKRDFTIAGYIDTSHGRVTTTVSGQQNFKSTQTIDFDTVNFTVLDQKTAVQNKVDTTTTRSSGDDKKVTSQSFSFPITVDVILPVSSAEFGLTVATTQDYQSSRLVWHDGDVEDFSSVNNSLSASDVSPASSQQHYMSIDSIGRYDCEVASASNTLTSVSRGCRKNH